MGAAVRYEDRVPRRNLVESSVFGAQKGGSDGEKLEVGASRFGSEAEAKSRTSMDASYWTPRSRMLGSNSRDRTGRGDRRTAIFRLRCVH